MGPSGGSESTQRLQGGHGPEGAVLVATMLRKISMHLLTLFREVERSRFDGRDHERECQVADPWPMAVRDADMLGWKSPSRGPGTALLPKSFAPGEPGPDERARASIRQGEHCKLACRFITA